MPTAQGYGTITSPAPPRPARHPGSRPSDATAAPRAAVIPAATLPSMIGVDTTQIAHLRYPHLPRDVSAARLRRGVITHRYRRARGYRAYMRGAARGWHRASPGG